MSNYEAVKTDTLKQINTLKSLFAPATNLPVKRVPSRVTETKSKNVQVDPKPKSYSLPRSVTD